MNSDICIDDLIKLKLFNAKLTNYSGYKNISYISLKYELYHKFAKKHNNSREFYYDNRTFFIQNHASAAKISDIILF